MDGSHYRIVPLLAIRPSYNLIHVAVERDLIPNQAFAVTLRLRK
jgi:hypothetical protein